jgi:hypothetical protein
MGASFLSLIQRFELLSFFAGYPLLYTLISVGGGYASRATGVERQRIPSLVPLAYAITGTLFLLFLIWMANRPVDLAIAVLRAWGVLAIIFWIPRVRRRPVFSLLHSLVFFGLIVQDILSGLATASGRDEIRNDMRILPVSLLFHAALFALTILVVFVRRMIRQRPPFNG